MLVKTIKFKDFNGNERSRDYYFNLSKSEITKMNLSKTGGLENWLARVTNADDYGTLYNLFEELVSNSYGVISEDGISFIKTKELSERFIQSNAFEAMFIEFMSDTNKAIEFFKGIMPADLVSKLPADAFNKITAENK